MSRPLNIGVPLAEQERSEVDRDLIDETGFFGIPWWRCYATAGEQSEWAAACLLRARAAGNASALGSSAPARCCCSLTGPVTTNRG